MSNNKELLNKIVVLLFTVLLIALSGYANTKYPDVTKHLGTNLPLNLKFKDSEGKTVLLRDLITKPTVIDFVYYRCPGICTPLMTGLSEVIGKVKYEPGKDYNIICISFDQNETPDMAAQKKRAMIGLSSRQIPDPSWAFLTGDSTAIYKITELAGFGFIPNYNGYLHKGVLIFVDKTGKIVQYLSPGYIKQTGDFQVLPTSFEEAIEKASVGEITPTILSVLQTCFTYIPTDRSTIILMLVLASGAITISVVLLIVKRTKNNRNTRNA